MKEKIEKAKLKLKETWAKHKDAIINVAVFAGGIVLGVLTYHCSTNKNTVDLGDLDRLLKMKETDLEKPDWDSSYEIDSYFKEDEFIRGMIVEMPITKLLGSDFGDKLVNECHANPDEFAGITIEYNSVD